MKDLISREAVIERIKYEADVCNSGITRGVLKLLQAIVEKMPSDVDAVEVVHAKWGIFGIDYKHEASLYECSACGKIVRKYWEDERFECCPYCGARMDGE